MYLNLWQKYFPIHLETIRDFIVILDRIQEWVRGRIRASRSKSEQDGESEQFRRRSNSLRFPSARPKKRVLGFECLNQGKSEHVIILIAKAKFQEKLFIWLIKILNSISFHLKFKTIIPHKAGLLFLSKSSQIELMLFCLIFNII